MQHELILIERVLDAHGPLHLAGTHADRSVSIQPEVYAVAPGLLGGVAGGIGRLHDCRCRRPSIVYRHEPDARTDTKTSVVVGEAEVGHRVADLLRHTLRLLGRA